MSQFGYVHDNTRDVLSQQYPSQIYSKMISIATVQLCGEYMIYFTWNDSERKKITDEFLTASPENTHVQNHSTWYLFLTRFPHSAKCFLFGYPTIHF